jgi:2-keto-3-deoxy-L-rhamnonate aldolase RhmA
VPESRPQQIRATLDLRHGEVLILYVEIESHARPLVQTFLYAPGDEKSA